MFEFVFEFLFQIVFVGRGDVMGVAKLFPAAVSFLLLLACAAPAQTGKAPGPLESRMILKGFLLSGGVVNTSEGQVGCVCKGGPARALAPRQELENGDTIQTGARGRAEILLAPGYFLRLSGDTEATLLDLSHDNMKVKVSKGSAIVEVSVNSSTHLFDFYSEEALKSMYDLVTVVTPSGEFALTRGGVYRVDVGAGHASELKVRKGLAVVGGKRVADGAAATVRGPAVEVSKSRGVAEDAFEAWSRERASRLVEANKSAKRTEWYRQLRRNPLSYFSIEDPEKPGRVKELFTVSALGGAVTFAEEGAAYRRGAAEWQKLREDDTLAYGDYVRTAETGRAEILLYPDCYLHLSAGAEAVYMGGEGEGVAVKLLKGSAIVGSKLGDGSEGLVTLSAGEARYELLKRGLYRLNVVPEGGSELLVYEGAARFAGGEIREGKKGVARGPRPSVSPIDRRARDGFDVWSEKRGAVHLVDSKFTRGLLLSFKLRRPQNVGLWYLEETSGEYTFIPGRWSFRSPYGGDYSVKFYSDIRPRYITMPGFRHPW